MKIFLLTVAVVLTFTAFPLAPNFTAQASIVDDEPRGDKEQYERSMEERLRKLGKELDRLKANARTRTEQGRKEMDRYIAEADKKQGMAARKLKEMQMKSQEKWKDFSDDLEFAVEEFEKAYERAVKRFKQ